MWLLDALWLYEPTEFYAEAIPSCPASVGSLLFEAFVFFLVSLEPSRVNESYIFLKPEGHLLQESARFGMEGFRLK